MEGVANLGSLEPRVAIPVWSEDRVFGNVGHLAPSHELRHNTARYYAEDGSAGYGYRRALEYLPPCESIFRLFIFAHA